MSRVGLPVACLAAAVAALAACGDDGGSPAGREVTLELLAEENGNEYGYLAAGTVDLRAGDHATFELRNDGQLPHDLAVIHPDGSTMATAPAAPPGGVVSVEVDLVDPGIYRLNCNVDDHLTRHGMQAFIEVSDPTK
jgi:uncharacterized cupredoxin-like copper-binding protein